MHVRNLVTRNQIDGLSSYQNCHIRSESDSVAGSPHQDSMNPITSKESIFLEVALPIPLQRNFTYKASVESLGEVAVGNRVVVPFGNRRLTGFIVATSDTLPADSDLEEEKVRAIVEILDREPLIGEEVLWLAGWASKYYSASLGELLRGCLPAGISVKFSEIIDITPKGIKRLEEHSGRTTKKEEILSWLIETGATSIEGLTEVLGKSVRNSVRDLIDNGEVSSHFESGNASARKISRKAAKLLNDSFDVKLSDQQRRVLSVLSSEPDQEMFLTELVVSADCGISPIRTLARKGLLEIFEKEKRRDPLAKSAVYQDERHELDEQQTRAVKELHSAMDVGAFETFLLRGVTGSGKTEVYFRVLEKALESGKSALMLVPEIALTPVFSKKLRARFGDSVAILHSSLGDGERHDEWHRIHEGEARIVIGTRSAIFSPLRDLGAIIVDEEHDASYRQQESPFYNARDLAVVRGAECGAIVILGSATPSMESFHNARNGKYRLIEMTKRVSGRSLASVEVIDMREEFKLAGKDVVFSKRLIAELRENKERGEQSIVLLNRRGFSQFVLCRSCGESMKCGNCDISLTYHKRARALLCHYCNFKDRVPDICPKCNGTHLYFIGEGTEQIHVQLENLMPDLRIARVDRDIAARRYDVENILHDFKNGDIDILVGTQMIAKGHDFPGVTLVGVVSVDTGLGLPDFRSSERTFQLLTQVAGRAGRGEKEGRVLIQTYYPDHYVLKHAQLQDYDAFFEEELRYRRNLAYPPFTAVASFLIKHKELAKAEEISQDLRDIINRRNTANRCRVLGPAPAPLSRLKDEYRIQIVLKAESRKELRRVVDETLGEAEGIALDLRPVSLEIDPISLL
jgi:primosomal protein N' (replication factor Y) (superfamily II helicase)